MDPPKILLLRSCNSLNILGKAMLHIVRTGVSRYEQEYRTEVFTTLFYMIVESEYNGHLYREYIPILQRSRHTPNVHPRENPLDPSFVHGRYLYQIEPHPCIDEPLQSSLWVLENLDQIQETLQRFIRPSYIPENEILPPPSNEIPPTRIPLPPPYAPQQSIQVPNFIESFDEENEQEDQQEETLPVPIVIPSRIASILLQDAETKNETCPISLEPIQRSNSSVTSCYHMFRTDELLQWNQTSNLCPVCKSIMVFTTPSQL
jgi:hypothetical protein